MAGQGRKIIKVGPGVEGLKPAGHGRREQMKERMDRLQMVAEKVTQENEVYRVPVEKLKEEPEILKHFDFVTQAFTVTNPKPGYAYLWERDDHRAVAFKKAQARYFLGNKKPGWEVVASSADPESKEVIQADNTRKIGDTILMRIPIDSYVEIQKRMALMQRFKEQNVPEKLSEFMHKHEGLVQVHQMVNETPREYFAKHGTPLQHTDSTGPVEMRRTEPEAGTLTESSEE